MIGEFTGSYYPNNPERGGPDMKQRKKSGRQVVKTKAQLEAEAHRRRLNAIIKAQAEFRAEETQRHMDELAEWIEGQHGYVAEGLQTARRTTRAKRG